MTIRFRSVVLPSGDEARVSAEAQDADGSFGVVAAVSGGRAEERSIGREVASDTATDVAVDLVGGGVLGRAAGSYLRESDRRSRRSGSGSRVTLSLPAGTEIRVFFTRLCASTAGTDDRDPRGNHPGTE